MSPGASMVNGGTSCLSWGQAGLMVGLLVSPGGMVSMVNGRTSCLFWGQAWLMVGLLVSSGAKHG